MKIRVLLHHTAAALLALAATLGDGLAWFLPPERVPLGRVIQSTAETSLDPLTLLVSLDGEGRASGRLYEDADDGYGYQKGDFLLTTYRAVREGRTITVTVERTEGSRLRPSRPVVIRLATGSGIIEATGRDGQPVALGLFP
jgi:alpha-glucosidase